MCVNKEANISANHLCQYGESGSEFMRSTKATFCFMRFDQPESWLSPTSWILLQYVKFNALPITFFIVLWYARFFHLVLLISICHVWVQFSDYMLTKKRKKKRVMSF